MATANDKGAHAPTQPINPFIVPNDAEGTRIQLDAVLAFIQEFEQGQIEALKNTYPDNTTYVFGLIHVIGGVRDAVKYLSYLDAVPTGNVTRLEVSDD